MRRSARRGPASRQRRSRCSATWDSAGWGFPGSASERARAAPEATTRPLHRLELALGDHRPRPDRNRDLGLGVRLLAALAATLAAKQEEDAADEPDRLLVLDRMDRFSLGLAHVGSDRLAEAAVVVRLDLRTRRRLEKLTDPVHLLLRQGQLDSSLGDRPRSEEHPAQ